MSTYTAIPLRGQVLLGRLMGTASQRTQIEKALRYSGIEPQPARKERRRFFRFPASLVVNLRPACKKALKASGRTRTTDISKAGAFIETLNDYDPGDEVEFGLDLPGAKKTIRVAAVVRWCNWADPKGMGVEFIKMSRNERKTLNEYLDPNFANP